MPSASLPPAVQTYHCLCTSLLLASTHILSTLPRRQGSSLDNALILPLPPAPPTHALSPEQSPEPEDEDRLEENERLATGVKGGEDMPPQGYSILLGLTPDKHITIIRRKDGFEKRLLYRCSRCRLVAGYELQSAAEAMDLDTNGNGGDGEYTGKVVYLLPAGITSTDVMVAAGTGGRKVGEEDVGIKAGALAAFE